MTTGERGGRREPAARGHPTGSPARSPRSDGSPTPRGPVRRGGRPGEFGGEAVLRRKFTRQRSGRGSELRLLAVHLPQFQPPPGAFPGAAGRAARGLARVVQPGAAGAQFAVDRGQPALGRVGAAQLGQRLPRLVRLGVADGEFRAGPLFGLDQRRGPLRDIPLGEGLGDPSRLRRIVGAGRDTPPRRCPGPAEPRSGTATVRPRDRPEGRWAGARSSGPAPRSAAACPSRHSPDRGRTPIGPQPHGLSPCHAGVPVRSRGR